MKITRLAMTALAVVIVGGTIAGATPHLVAAVSDRKTSVEPSDTPSPSESPDPTETPEPTESPDPTETPEPTESPEPPVSEDGGSKTGPDFSACVGLTGLENAICRHEALLVVHPDNTGLQNSLSHLEANLAKHSEQSHGNSGESHGQSGQPHGHSGEPHGNGS